MQIIEDHSYQKQSSFCISIGKLLLCTLIVSVHLSFFFFFYVSQSNYFNMFHKAIIILACHELVL